MRKRRAKLSTANNPRLVTLTRLARTDTGLSNRRYFQFNLTSRIGIIWSVFEILSISRARLSACPNYSHEKVLSRTRAPLLALIPVITFCLVFHFTLQNKTYEKKIYVDKRLMNVRKHCVSWLFSFDFIMSVDAKFCTKLCISWNSKMFFQKPVL